ncbi:MAG: hypothetical protein H9872_04125 [Candidatus Cellulosilyticum pullistercoris]|uniref:Uncharacterized protein n=1 Tax=Candidatus Cellulosilyticum pullistercoris TaxID=2838521 RepID=A0A9E2NKQ3_9FIRM|nr:hypothetical protein [Candidatus Cellulosilyticum pullistercoris]
MNPFLEKSMPVENFFNNWENIYPQPYNKYTVDPYTRTRIILMNGTEIESIFFSHQFARNCTNNDLRREIAILRRLDQQQQKIISVLKPADESILEHTIGYEQLAVDLTAELAQREPDCYVKMALDFALLEDFDHLYRYSDLAYLEYGEKMEYLVGHYTEIMPGRPTIAHHRFPTDNIKYYTDFDKACPITKLNTFIITAAEQQTMNYYMNVVNLYCSDLGRKLYQEIALVEEEHVSQYESLLDPNLTWLENLLMHKYNECYLYYSCYCDETDECIKKIWECHYYQEIAQLHRVAHLLEKYEGKCWNQVIPDGEFPQLLRLHSNKEYIRKIQENTVELTSKLEKYVDVEKLPCDDVFFKMQDILNEPVCQVPSHIVIDELIQENGIDYRYEVAPNPIKALRNRHEDNVCVGRS